MKRFVSVSSLAATMLFSAGVFADNNGPMLLGAEQLDSVNGGIAFAFARSEAAAAGVFFSATTTTTSTVAVSVLAGGLSAAGSDSRSGSASFAF